MGKFRSLRSFHLTCSGLPREIVACICFNALHAFVAVPFAYDTEYVWSVTGLAQSQLYWVRCRAYLDTYFGPWAPSVPPFIVVDQ